MSKFVDFLRDATAPKGTKSIDPVIAGALIVALAPAALTKLLEFLHAWAMRRDEHNLKIKIQKADGSALEIEVPTSMPLSVAKKWISETAEVIMKENSRKSLIKIARRALIIGNSKYQDPTLAELITPGEDAEKFADVLRAPDIGNFEVVTTLVDDTEGIIRREISRFLSKCSLTIYHYYIFPVMEFLMIKVNYILRSEIPTKRS